MKLIMAMQGMMFLSGIVYLGSGEIEKGLLLVILMPIGFAMSVYNLR